ncbi:MAG TPA: anti-sigma regulatory factor [Bacteroidales bacterium]|jgi:anti-sigma regulatory factor (Ser/Thr protein kinase)|nr:anti-sigma regulatory factor [Bacteroidales bacterium]HOL97204.1 anti-sigma regulatory factor [Bacteroidales bacterium]HOM35496.1 anti-sigma regulatory factor [Bacteroidales bacterium]HPD24265.1 anti-sigma regulatory factor [Bacteroidales bacterium]HRS98660.1 anti-sigma regulatory factor [Bacteroidales bacterium]
MQYEFQIEGGNFSGAGESTSVIKKTLKQLGIDSTIIKRVVIALFEAEINVVAHAYNGKMIVEIFEDQIKMIVEDNGPGIENIELAMQEGYSTASEKVREMGFGAGMGLPNIKKNTDVLNIQSTPGVGTKLEMIVYI